MLARLEKLISEPDGLVDDIEKRDPELGLLASEVWEAPRDIAGRLREKEVRHGTKIMAGSLEANSTHRSQVHPSSALTLPPPREPNTIGTDI